MLREPGTVLISHSRKLLIKVFAHTLCTLKNDHMVRSKVKWRLNSTLLKVTLCGPQGLQVDPV